MIKEIRDTFERSKDKTIEESKTKLFDKIEYIFKDPKYYVSPKNKLIYFKIDKCASTSVIECLTKQSDFIPVYDSDLHTEKKITRYNVFTVIRDPKSRWISGLNQFIYEEVSRDIIEGELKNHKFIFDGHTLPQVNFLPSCTDNIILLRLDRNLNQKISLLLGENVELKHKNTTSSDTHKKNNLNFCKKMFETYCERNPRYYQTYEFDYRLFNISK